MENPNQSSISADVSPGIPADIDEEPIGRHPSPVPEDAASLENATSRPRHHRLPAKRAMTLGKKIAIGCGCAAGILAAAWFSHALWSFSMGQLNSTNDETEVYSESGNSSISFNGSIAADTISSTSGSYGGNGSLGWGTDILSDADMGNSIDAPSYSFSAPSLPSVNENAFDYEENKGLPPEEGGFISTKVQHVSTVSSDVDTASYANLRRAINNGESYFYTDQIRIEEMLNYFDYDYALPEGDDKFSISKEVAACPWNEDTQLVSLGFTSAPETGVRENGANLVFLIDVSGSMDEPNKLPLLQDSFAELVKHLDENDCISVVTYSGREDVVLEGVSGSEKDRIQKAIDNLLADGFTNGEAGMRMAYQIAREHYIEGGVNRIVMATDGDLNVGMNSLADLHDFVAKKKEQGIYLSVLGFGDGNYKDTTMETLADNGNGNYHYIDCVEEAERVFNERLLANLVPFANDVKIQIDFNAAQVKAYRLIGYENRTLAAEDFRDDTKDAGDIGPAQQFTVLYEVVPQTSVLTPRVLGIDDEGDEKGRDSDEWMNVTMRYKMIGNSPFDFFNPDIREQQISVSAADEVKAPGNDWKFAAAVAQAGMALKSSAHLNDATLGEAIVLAEEASGDDPLRKEFVDLMKRADKAAFDSSYEKAVRDGIQKHFEKERDDAVSKDSYLENRENKSNISKNSNASS